MYLDNNQAHKKQSSKFCSPEEDGEAFSEEDIKLPTDEEEYEQVIYQNVNRTVNGV
jgi:hypothetical protein